MGVLTLPPTAFIGRSEEIDALGALLDDSACRLLTLVGPGGIGKTRLALEVAWRKQDSFPDGVFWVSLAPLTQPSDIFAAIVEAMPFRFQQNDRDPRDQFFDYLREKRAQSMLLILDNFEHLLSGLDIVSDILDSTTDLKIIVTSREVLNLQEEWVRQIAGMSYPHPGDDHPLETYSAVQLFLDRARRIRGNFDLAEDSRSVVEICQLVEGMPLAIELAVGWLKTLSPADIAEEIRRNKDILATRSRNLPERHRSIRSVFMHSWLLMSADEQAAFEKLSVFRGGFTREAAEVVAGASLFVLAGLVDKSLVRLNAAGRHDVHELLRQFGAEQLEAAGQTEALQRAYIDYTLGMLHRLEPEIKAHHQVTSLDFIQADFENVRHAWLLALERGCYDALDSAVESLQLFGDMRGRYHEAVALLRAAVDHLQHVDTQVYLLRRIQARLIRLILLGHIRIDFDLREQMDICLAAAREHNDQAEIGFCLLISGILTCWEQYRDEPYSNPRAESTFRASLTVYEQLGDPFYQAEALVWMAATADDEQHSDQALELGLKIRREIDDRNGIAWIMLNLTEVMLMHLDYVECERISREALALMREIGSLKGILRSMFQLAQTVTLKGDLDEARALAEQMHDLADQTNNLDGKMLSSGLLTFLVCVMDENYAGGAAYAQENRAISLEPFFGGHEYISVRFGKAIAECGLEHYDTVRQSFPLLYWDRRDDPAPAAICLALDAVLRAHDGKLETAVERLSLAFAQPVWANGWLSYWALVTRLRASLESQLGAKTYGAAWERGCHLDLEAAVESIIGEANIAPQAAPTSPLLEPLSDRELEILRFAAEGLSNQQIANTMVLALGTVKSHLHNIYGKLGIESRTQAIARARELNLI